MTLTKLLRSAVPLLLLAGAVAAPQAQADTRSFYYVASAGAGGSDIPRLLDIYPLGSFTFPSPGRSFTLKLDDTATLTGAKIPVHVFMNGKGTSACIPARTPMRLNGGKQGAKVTITIDTAVEAELRCGGSGTTGTAYVTG